MEVRGAITAASTISVAVVIIAGTIGGVQADNDDDAWTEYEETFDLEVTQVLIPTIRTDFGSNCIVDQMDVAVSWRNVSFTASWTPLAPNTEELILETWTFAHDVTMTGQDEGRSPLRIDAQLIELDPNDHLVVPVQVPRDPPRVALKQPVELTVAMEHRGDAPEFEIGGCSFA